MMECVVIGILVGIWNVVLRVVSEEIELGSMWRERWYSSGGGGVWSWKVERDEGSVDVMLVVVVM